MRDFKKKTVSLLLASVLTVAGAFGAENFKNSILNMTFESNGNDINLLLHTKSNFEGNITPVKKDANTYVVMLPEFNSQAKKPNFEKVSSNITNVTVRTMPYSNGSKGYTRITIKTTPATNLTAKAQAFVPNQDGFHGGNAYTEQSSTETSMNDINAYRKQLEEEQRKEELERQRKEQQQKLVEAKQQELLEQQRRAQAERSRDQYIAEKEYAKSVENKNPNNEYQQNKTDTSVMSKEIYEENSNDAFLLVMGILLLCGLIAYFYVRAKNKLQELAGEKITIDVSDEDTQKPKPSKKEKKLKKIKNTIKNLDSAYSKTAVPRKNEYTVIEEPEPIQSEEPIETVNVVDLDELFKEQQGQTQTYKEDDEDENAALEDFLSGFSFDEEFLNNEEKEDEENNPGYDVEFYDKLINSDSQKFTKDDIEKMNKLLNSEIQDSTLRDIKKYAISNPIKKVPTKKEILENIVTSYAISQNIVFSKDDVNALYKLINVEIDKDFITDLRTNPERMLEMEKEILSSGEKPRKPSEILTLNVKDVLPDLSEALKKQGGREIKSEVKPETVYFSEGYEVSTLKISDELPDLTKVNKEQNSKYSTRPQTVEDLVDTSYEVKRLKISSQLPDLTEMLKNPEKYSKPKEEIVEADPEALLNNIVNVQFKPFEEGQSFEILNTQEDLENLPSEQLEYTEHNSDKNTKDDFVDLDKELAEELENLAIEQQQEHQEQKTESSKITETVLPKTKNIIQNLNQKINLQKPRFVEKKSDEIKKSTETKVIADIKCIFEGVSYTVVSSVNLIGNIGCYLAKNDKGYVVLGHIGDNLINLKEYSQLKSEKIQTRLSEKISDNVLRYIIRIGTNKFVVDVKDENEINYVMDL